MTRPPLLRPLAVRAHVGRFGGERAGLTGNRSGLTIVEMLVAMSITLLIMGAVVTVFANISGSVTRRRATIEMSSALRNVRETLARDLAGATCPAVPWQRPESNHGYLELIEGPMVDYYPTPFLYDGDPADGLPDVVSTSVPGLPGIDLAVSSLPGSNLGGNASNDFDGHGRTIGGNVATSNEVPSDGRGLGDGDDILMLTVRNEDQPFIGRVPSRRQLTGSRSIDFPFVSWEHEEISSPLAEVVWFAVENPVDPNRTFAFGEPGYRTIHRRALLILPELSYQFRITGEKTNYTKPGIVRVLGTAIDRSQVHQAIAALIAFQDRYDLSVHLEWDPLLPGVDASSPGRWVIKANTLADLTKRENRFEHHGYVSLPTTYGSPDRYYPFVVASGGRSAAGPTDVSFVPDPELQAATTRPTLPARFRSFTWNLGGRNAVVAFEATDADVLAADRRYDARPFAVVNAPTDTPATARAILDEDGHVVHVVRGLAPLGGARRGEDVMLTEALAFDVRVYDPGAPVYGYYPNGANNNTPPEQMLSPGDPAWAVAYARDVNDGAIGDNNPATSTGFPFRFDQQGAYVDMGYGARGFVDPTAPETLPPASRFIGWQTNGTPNLANAALVAPRFSDLGDIRPPGYGLTTTDVLTTLFSVYDTWSWHYENNGVDEDRDGDLDEAANGLDNAAAYANSGVANPATLFGPDDYAERETRAPYDTALRGVQVSLRVYERDSRQVREVRVRESFVPE